MIAADDERVHPPSGPGFGESVTFAWGDAAGELYGSARLGLGADGTASALALLFAGERPVAVAAAGGEEVADPSWDRIEVGGVAATIEAPLEAWTVSVDSAEGGFSLRFEALTTPPEGALAGTEGDEAPRRGPGT